MGWEINKNRKKLKSDIILCLTIAVKRRPDGLFHISSFIMYADAPRATSNSFH